MADKGDNPRDDEKSRQQGLERFENFKKETQRLHNGYWASVRRINKKLRNFYTPLMICHLCDRLVPYTHQCDELHPVNISMEEKLRRKDDPFNDLNWDYEWIPDGQD